MRTGARTQPPNDTSPLRYPLSYRSGLKMSLNKKQTEADNPKDGLYEYFDRIWQRRSLLWYLSIKYSFHPSLSSEPTEAPKKAMAPVPTAVK